MRELHQSCRMRIASESRPQTVGLSSSQFVSPNPKQDRIHSCNSHKQSEGAHARVHALLGGVCNRRECAPSGVCMRFRSVSSYPPLYCSFFFLIGVGVSSNLFEAPIIMSLTRVPILAAVLPSGVTTGPTRFPISSICVMEASRERVSGLNLPRHQ